MANVPISNMTATWIDSGTTYTAVKMNVTDTASNAASNLMDLQVGGSSRFAVSKTGLATATVGFRQTSTGAGISVNSNGNRLSLYSNNSEIAYGDGTNFTLASTTSLNWAPSAASSGSVDITLARDAANTLAQRNATNAQTFRIYNTFTDASNYERGFLKWNTNVLEIGTEAAGTGTARNVVFQRGGSDRITLTSNGIEFAPAGTLRSIFASSGALISRSIIALNSDQIGFSSASSTNIGNTLDTAVARSAAAVLAVTNGSTGGGALEFIEQTAPAAPAANGVRIYAEDNGSGKTRLMALFATGAAQQIAIEP